MLRATTVSILLLLTLVACSDEEASSGPSAGGDTGADTASDADGADVDTNDTADPDVASDVPEPETLEGLVINEVAASGDPADWVELHNASDQAIDLARLGLGDDPDDPTTRALFGQGVRIEARAHLVIYLDPDGFPGFRLGSDEVVALFGPEGAVLDVADWDEGQSPDRASWGRIPDATGPFKVLLRPTPGAPNVDNVDGAVCGDGQTTGDEQCDDANPTTGDGCAPGCRIEDGWTCDGAPSVCETRCGDGVVAGDERCDPGPDVPNDACRADCTFALTPSDVVINEVVARPVSGEDWIELFNVGEATVDLSGWVLTDEQGLEQGFSIPAGVRLAAGAYRVFERDAADSFTFGLGPDEAVFLYDEGGRLVDLADWADGDAPEGSSWGRSPDGDGAFKTLTPPTRGASNR